MRMEFCHYFLCAQFSLVYFVCNQYVIISVCFQPAPQLVYLFSNSNNYSKYQFSRGIASNKNPIMSNFYLIISKINSYDVVIFFRQIGDFNVSLALMQVRVHQIARMVFRCDNFSNVDILNEESSPAVSRSSISNDSNYSSIRSTLDAIKFILKMYKNEVKQFKCVDHLEFSTLADIIVTIHRILNLNDLSNLIR